jgi:hypothetical protein
MKATGRAKKNAADSPLAPILLQSGAELVKGIRRDSEHFECAPWVHKPCCRAENAFAELPDGAEASGFDSVP